MFFIKYKKKWLVVYRLIFLLRAKCIKYIVVYFPFKIAIDEI